MPLERKTPLFFFFDIRRVYATDIGDGELRWGGESRGREKREGTVKAMRQGRRRRGRGSEGRVRGKAVLWPETWSARRLFFGRNRSYTAPWNFGRRAHHRCRATVDFAEKTEGDMLVLLWRSCFSPPRRRDPARTINIERTPLVFGEPRQSTIIEDHVENKERSQRAPWINDVWHLCKKSYG